jgi:hypothetical protein
VNEADVCDGVSTGHVETTMRESVSKSSTTERQVRTMGARLPGSEGKGDSVGAVGKGAVASTQIKSPQPDVPATIDARGWPALQCR